MLLPHRSIFHTHISKIMHKDNMAQQNKAVKSIPVVSMHAPAQPSPGWTLRGLLLGQHPKNSEEQ